MWYLINKEDGLENEISDSEYNSLPHYKKLKYRKKESYSSSTYSSSDDTPSYPSSNFLDLPGSSFDFGSSSDSGSSSDFGGFGGGDGGGGGASGDW